MSGKERMRVTALPSNTRSEVEFGIKKDSVVLMASDKVQCGALTNLIFAEDGKIVHKAAKGCLYPEGKH